MEVVWNLNLCEFFKPVGTAVLNVMAGVTATLASSRFLKCVKGDPPSFIYEPCFR